MRLRIVLMILLFVTTLLPQTVSAGDYVTDAVEALKTSNVYVAPGTEGTDYNTESYLQGFLNADDNIVLVMLPSDALEGTDMLSLAQEISAGIGNQKTIGLTVGRSVIGYSAILPEGVAEDKMMRADSVSNDPVTALITFTQNIHSWLIKYPQPTPIPTPKPTPVPIELPKVEDITWPVWTFLGLFALVVFGILTIKANQSVKRQKVEAQRRKRRESLDPIDQLIQQIESNVARVQDRRVRDDLKKACLAAYGLLEIFQGSEQTLGITEIAFPSTLESLNTQVVALIRHESGKRPLSSQVLNDTIKTLLNYDSLFVKLQQNDPDAIKLLTSLYQSHDTMISQLGYLPEDK